MKDEFLVGFFTGLAFIGLCLFDKAKQKLPQVTTTPDNKVITIQFRK